MAGKDEDEEEVENKLTGLHRNRFGTRHSVRMLVLSQSGSAAAVVSALTQVFVMWSIAFISLMFVYVKSLL